MNYEETLKYIHSIPKFSRVLGNELLLKLLDKMNNPQNELNFIHIGGTNGKGSTSTMVSQILIESGYKVGLFTSPYIERFNERFRLDGNPIPDIELVHIVDYVKSTMEEHNTNVSEFAFNTAVALEYFKRNDCDFVILEVGLGGKLDATNIINNPVAIGFASIGLDHCQYLGDTVDKISKEKFGIIKNASDVVLYPIQQRVVFENAKKFCKQTNSRLIIPNLPTKTSEQNSFIYDDTLYHLRLDGEFQIYNAVTAIEIIKVLINKGYAIPLSSIKKGLSLAYIGGRLEYALPNVLLDSAHNPQAVNTLVNELKRLEKKIHFLVMVMDDKDYCSIAKIISQFTLSYSAKITTTEIDMPRCLPASKLAEIFNSNGVCAESVTDPIAAFDSILENLTDSELLCVVGSIYLVGDVKRHINL